MKESMVLRKMNEPKEVPWEFTMANKKSEVEIVAQRTTGIGMDFAMEGGAPEEPNELPPNVFNGHFAEDDFTDYEGM